MHPINQKNLWQGQSTALRGQRAQFWGFNTCRVFKTDVNYFRSAYRSSQSCWEACAIINRQVKPANQAGDFSFHLSVVTLRFIMIYFFLLLLELELVTSTTVITRPWGRGQTLSPGNITETSPLMSGAGEISFINLKQHTPGRSMTALFPCK